jgi:hypothetical protein
MELWMSRTSTPKSKKKRKPDEDKGKPPARRANHPWRRGPAVVPGLTESRQIERSLRKSENTFLLVRPKKKR